MDPNIVNSTAFQLLWNATFNAQELVGLISAYWKNATNEK
jgi:hypothetical protein